jgi:hypothetical protein
VKPKPKKGRAFRGSERLWGINTKELETRVFKKVVLLYPSLILYDISNIGEEECWPLVCGVLTL